ncbi:hypothetical protein H0H93_013535 [Arthromyces matolae]|nr:hypothetical protein H0H93_013535 [Arthromyces matolae]
MSGTHDILAAERAAATDKRSNQGIQQQGQSEGQAASIATDTVLDKDNISGASENIGRTSATAQDISSGGERTRRGFDPSSKREI